MAGGDISAQNENSLNDWIRKFRMKKFQMKRKVRNGKADLRVYAIMATALNKSEKELRQKQQERYIRWSNLQFELIQNQAQTSPNYSLSGIEAIKRKQEEETEKKKIAELYKSEIKSLDEFMRSMSSQPCVVSS